MSEPAMEITPLVLVVDDEDMVRQMLCTQLELIGYVAVSASNGPKALELCAERHPAIIFTDLNMPGMSGLELIPKLKALNPDVPIIVVSGAADMESAIGSLRLGAWEYVCKPVDMDALQHVAQRTLERARLIAENQAYQERLEDLVLERTQELRDSEMRYRTLFESANDAIILMSNGVIESCNRKTGELLGMQPDEAVGRTLCSFSPPEHPCGSPSAVVFQAYEYQVMAGVPQSFEWRFHRSDVGEFDAEISLNRLELHGIPHMQAIMRDITERKRAATALLENSYIKHDMEIARNIQRSLLPASPPEVRGFRVACRCTPAASVGGDYFDFFPISPHSFDVVIADVAGHSFGSALLMAEARTVLHARAEIDSFPAQLLASANELLYDDLNRAELQISAFSARLDSEAGTIAYANAGHARPFFYRSGSDTLEELDAEGMLLGIFREVAFEERECPLEPGDLLLLYTDGACDVENGAGEFFGTERLQRVIIEMKDEDPEEILGGIFRNLAHFAGGKPLADDVSLVVIKAISEYT
jgi:sigma-B regulation protein RsbU (phosphoserine phosphatase)